MLAYFAICRLWVVWSRLALASGRPLSRQARSRSQKAGDLLESRRWDSPPAQSESATSGRIGLVTVDHNTFTRPRPLLNS